MEREMLEGIKRGDSQAFAQLITQHQDLVYSIALNTLCNEQDAYDISQEIFIKIYNNIDKFSGKSKLSTWIYRLAKNMCIDYIRKQNRQRTVSLNDEISTHSQSSPSLEYERKETINTIRECLKLLPEDTRTILTMRDINGLSYTHISEILGCSLGTVKSRISRARQSLRKLLEQTELFNNSNV